MRFPSWGEFNRKVSEFETKITEKVIEFKDDHPLLDKTVNELLPYLPPPFNGIAQNLYNSFEGNNEEKIGHVIGSLNEIKKQGEAHYEKICMNLDSILIEIKDIKKIIENEQGTKKICMLFSSKIESLDSEIIEIGKTFGIKLDKIQNDILRNQNLLNEILSQIKLGKEIPIGGGVNMDKISPEISQKLFELYEENRKLHKKLESPEKHFEENLLQELTVSFYHTGKFDSALDITDQILKKNKKNILALANKSTILNRLNKFKESLKCVNKVLKIDSKYYLVLVNKGIALRHLRKFDEALKCYDEFISKDDSIDVVYSSKAVTLAEIRKFDEAIVNYKKALDMSPERPSVIYGSLGMSQLLSGKYEDGMKSIEKGLELDEKCTVCLNNKAIAYGMKGDKAKELELFKYILEIDPNHIDGMNNIGYDLLEMGNVEESLTYFDNALEIFPQFTSALTHKSLALLKLNKLEESLKVVNESLKIDGKYISALFTKARILCQMRDFHESKNNLRKILSLNPSVKNQIIEDPLLMGLSTDKEFLEMIR